MPFVRPKGLLAGYHAQAPASDVPEIVHFGEQWAPRTFQIGLHSHDIWEFYLQIKGETIWEAQGREYRVGPAGLFAAPPAIAHRLILTPDSSHHFYFLAVDVSRVLANRPDMLSNWRADRIVSVRNAHSLLTPFQTLARELTLDLPYRSMGIRAALNHLLIEASRLIVTSGRAAKLFPEHQAVTLARELMDLQPERSWSLSELAARANVSPAHLGERFRIEVGVAPRQYLIQVRLDRAIKLLGETEASITEIALDLGFSSSQHMATTLKKRTGRTPSEHRLGKPGRADGILAADAMVDKL